MMLLFLGFFVPAAFSQDIPAAELPKSPTVASLSMHGTGCPIGGGGIVSSAIDGTPVFSFPAWTMDLATEGEDGRLEKFCVQDMQLANGPVGYQVQLSAVTVRGVAGLEDAVLGAVVETSLGGEEAGRNEVILLASNAPPNGTFTSRIKLMPEIWSECVDEDGEVPLIRLRTTLFIEREGENATGWVGTEGGELEDTVRVHFEASWRECE